MSYFRLLLLGASVLAPLSAVCLFRFGIVSGVAVTSANIGGEGSHIEGNGPSLARADPVQPETDRDLDLLLGVVQNCQPGSCATELVRVILSAAGQPGTQFI